MGVRSPPDRHRGAAADGRRRPRRHAAHGSSAGRRAVGQLPGRPECRHPWAGRPGLPRSGNAQRRNGGPGDERTGVIAVRRHDQRGALVGSRLSPRRAFPLPEVRTVGADDPRSVRHQRAGNRVRHLLPTGQPLGHGADGGRPCRCRRTGRLGRAHRSSASPKQRSTAGRRVPTMPAIERSVGEPGATSGTAMPPRSRSTWPRIHTSSPIWPMTPPTTP